MRISHCMILFFISAHCVSCREILTSSSKALPKFNLTNYVLQQGYPIEVHQNLRTEDGYLLDIHRIPHGGNSTANNTKPAVFLMHGLGSSANGWIVPGPNHSLAFLLADRGYDVWIGNARGTSYSKKHVRYDPERNPEKFWDFSWHEIGHYDLYSMINYIMNVTQQSQMFYIGHSQGCTCYFALMSTRPEMNKHVNLMVALAPGVFFGSPAITPEFFAFSVFHQIDFSRKLLGMYTDNWGPQMKELTCFSPVSTKATCDAYFSIINAFLGFDPSKTRPEHWTLIQQTIPDSGSIKQNLHYIQIILTGEFRQYHLGREENLRKYGLELPPLYSLNRVSSPVTLFAGEKDTQARPENVQKLGTILPNVAELHVVSEFSHVDFLAADSTVELVFDEIFALMYNYAK